MSVQGETIVRIIGGEKYQGAIISFAIMAMFPIHQTFGQLSAALLIATGQTKLYAKLAVIVMVGSLPISYFLLASDDYLIPGLALGATGLAVKMVLIQFVGTNIQLYFNTKMLNLSFYKWLFYQFQTVGAVYFLATLSYWLANEIPFGYFLSCNVFDVAPDTFSMLARFCVAGLFYFGFMVVLIALAPSLANLKEGELIGMFHRKLPHKKI